MAFWRTIGTLSLAFCFLYSPLAVREGAGSASAREVDNEVEEFDFANGLFARGMYDLAIDGYADFLEKYPNSRYSELAVHRIGEAYFLAGKYDEALDRFSLFLNDYPTSDLRGKVSLRLGQISFLRGDLTQAEKTFSGLVSAPDPDISLAAKYYLAAVYFKLKDLDRAKGFLEEILKTETANEYTSFAHMNLGDIYAEKGDQKGAAGSYAMAVESTSDERTKAEAAFRAARSSELSGDLSGAEKFYSMGMDLAGSGEVFDEAAAGLIGAFQKEGKHDQAILTAEKVMPRLSSDEARARVSYLQGNSYFARKDMEEALSTYSETYSRYPSSEYGIKSALNVCWTLEAKGDHEACVERIDEYLSKHTYSREEAVYLKGRVLDKMGRDSEAIEVYASLVEGDRDTPLSADALYDLAWLCVSEGDGPRASGLFRKFAETYPDDPRAAGALVKGAQERMKSGDLGSAKDDLNRFFQLFKENELAENAMYSLASIHYGQKEYGKAEETLKRMMAEFPVSSGKNAVLYLLAKTYQSRGEWEKAIEKYSIIAADVSDSMYAPSAESMAFCYFQKGDKDKAAEIYYKVMTSAPEYSLPEGVYKWVADHYLKSGEMRSSLAALKGYTDKYPQASNSLELDYMFGENHRLLGEYDKAEAYYRKVIDQGGDSPAVARALLGIGRAYSEKGDFEKSLESLSMAVDLQGDNITGALARMEIADLRFKTLDYEKASKDYMMVAILYDDKDISPRALYRAAEAFEKSGKPDKSIEVLKELLARYKESKEAGMAEAGIRRLDSAKK